MGRLISEDDVMRMLTSVALNNGTITDAKSELRNVKTAYNVDAVVAELGNIKVKHSYNPIKDEIMYKGIDLEEVTSIVRKGGVE